MIQEAYVSYETARLLKEKGFDETCYACYEYFSSGVTMYSGWPFEYKGEVVQNSKDRVKCPTQQLAMRWLREVHNLFIVIDIGFSRYISDFYYTATVHKLDDDIAYPVNQINNGEYSNPERASEDAIKYCLEHLIE